MKKAEDVRPLNAAQTQEYLREAGLASTFKYIRPDGKSQEAVCLGKVTQQLMVAEDLKATDNESLIINDPKGDAYKALGVKMAEAGFTVKHIRLGSSEGKAQWNCINEIRAEESEDDICLLVRTLSDNIGYDGPACDTAELGKTLLLKALIAHVALDPALEPERKSLGEVRRLLNAPNSEKVIDKIFNETEHTGAGTIAGEAYAKYKSLSSIVRRNAVLSLRKDMAVVCGEAGGDAAGSEPIDLELPGKQPCVYFCEYNEKDRASATQAALFYTMAIYRLARYADMQPDGKTKMHATILLNDFPVFGIIPDLDAKVATARKRNLAIGLTKELVGIFF